MIAIGLLFKWINVLLVVSYIIYQVIVNILPALHMQLKDRLKKRAERLACIKSFKDQRLAINAALEQQQQVIDQLSTKVAYWHTYEMEAKKKLQTHHSKIYHDAKKRIECQTNFLIQHTALANSVDALIANTKQQLLADINQQEHKTYIQNIVDNLTKENHGL